MHNTNLYRKALIYDYLCLILCVFAIFMLLYSNATVSQEAFDGSTVVAVPEKTDDTTGIYPDLPTDRTSDLRGRNLQSPDLNGKAVKA